MKTKLRSLYSLLQNVEKGEASINDAIVALDDIIKKADDSELMHPADFFLYFIEEIQKQQSISDFIRLIVSVFYKRELILPQGIVFVSTRNSNDTCLVMRGYQSDAELNFESKEAHRIFAIDKNVSYNKICSGIEYMDSGLLGFAAESEMSQLIKQHGLKHLYHITFYHLPNSNQKLTVNFLSPQVIEAPILAQIELILKLANSIPVNALTSLQTKYREDIINLAMDASPFVLLLFDHRGKLIKANESANKYYHPSTKEKINLFDHVLPHTAIDRQSLDKLSQGDILNVESLNPELFVKGTIPTDFYEGRMMPIFYHSKTPSYYLVILEFNKTRKDIADKLRREKEKYELIFYSIQDIYFEALLDGTITEVSPSVFNHSGHTREEMLGSNVMSYYADAASRQNYIDNLKNQGYINNYEAKFVRKEGGLITVLINSRLHRKAGDSEPCIIGSMTDITSYIQMLDALNSNQRKLNSVFENAPFGIVTFDLMGNILDVNHRLLALLGSPSISATMSFNIFKIPNIRDAGIVADIQQAIDTKSIRIVEREYRSQWNIAGFYRIYISPVINNTDKVEYVLLMLEDITEKREKDRAFAEMQERFRDIYENTNDLIYTMDFDGNFTSVNPVSERILGYTFEQVSNLSMKNYITLDSYNRAKENIVEKLQGERDKSNYEVVTFDKNGNKIVLEINSRLRFKEGKPLEVFGIGRDITERKKYEEELHMALKEKDILIREIHHRVKNNLQMILSFIKMHAQKFHDHEVIESFNDIKRKILTISSFHEDLYFGKDMYSVNIKTYINSLIRNQYEMSKASIHIRFENNIEDVVTNIDVSIPLGLIVSELVSNATRYAFVDSERDPLVKVKLHDTPEGISLVVADNGKGLPEEILRRTKNSLGIQLVEMLTSEQLGGKFNIESSSAGTTFSILIPG